MSEQKLYGYNGKILRVDLSKGTIKPEKSDETDRKNYVGGAALGIKYIYDEVPPNVAWSDPANRVYLGAGPLSGTRVAGSGSIAAVSKGPMTNGMASTQANGYFGAFLRFSGFDALILQGAAPEWSYLYIHDGTAELKSARQLMGKNNYEVDKLLREELKKGEHDLSVLSIGPAGENLVRFACLFVDMGHMASHNGVGAVLGSKKLKAIAVARGKGVIPLKDREAISAAAKELKDFMLAGKMSAGTYEHGTVGGVIMGTKGGMLPVRNYTSNVNPMPPEKLETYSWEAISPSFFKVTPCWACSASHCHTLRIPKGTYAGWEVEEPEFEGLSAFSALVGIEDVNMSIALASEVDRLGMDVNESGWVFAWLMECYEKGTVTKKDTDGLEMTWGNGEAVMAMLRKIATRQGFGNVLAEGVMRAARQVGGKAPELAIHTMKGNTPRSHDHRAMWMELFDTCVSNTGTLEAHSAAPMALLGIPFPFDTYSPELVSTNIAKIKGAMIFEDSMVTCRFNTNTALDLMCKAVNAATGWNIDFHDAMNVGKRAVNLARVFNLRAGIPAELDAPSPRYGSTLPDGLAAGKGILPHWDMMRRNYYKNMGWDEKTGSPLPETLKELGLDFVIPQLPNK
ncbi:MAG: aldehyde ferredoxin oxidoreductase C-terminal domain-containing protein [Dehalococcoidales bacterium]